MRVLVTGAGGFMGAHLLRGLPGHSVIAASRQPIDGQEWRRLGDLRGEVDWDGLVADVDAVVHLANIAHQTASEEDFARVNHRATAELAAAARRQGVKNLIYVSSIYAQAGHSSPDVVTEVDAPRPVNAYGRSKLAAERAVADSGAPFTILRPVLVLGEGAKGNIKTLYRLARLPVPLPLASIPARRSFLSVENFAAGVAIVLANPQAAGETYIMADRQPLSVGELVATARAALGRRPGLFPFPPGGIEAFLQLAGARGIWEKIGTPLVASSDKLQRLGWSPTR